ncbi:MAG: hypothetical protein FJ184_16610 [Gammaproteobacteria bacterium]|nr:hypothetical protein [Gammaproteobacteria bacterium]
MAFRYHLDPMENPNPAPPAYDDEIDLWELWETIWSGRWLVVVIAGLFTLSGTTYALLSPEVYRAEVVLAPAENRKGGAVAQFGGLAGLAGISLPGAGESEPIAVLKSKDFARAFITDLNLIPELSGDGDLVGDKTDIRDAVAAFDGVRSVTEDKKTGLVIVSIRWKDPDTAAEWANALVKHLNDRLRSQAQAESERNVAFLQREIAATSVVSLQQSMGRVLEGEMQKLMLARGNDEFAFKVIDRAVPPKQREAPKRTMIALVSMLAGGFLGIFAVFLRKAIANRPKR